MSNLFDFSDCQLSWRNAKAFNIEPVSIHCDSNAGADDEEDWFFPQPSISVPDDITAPYKEKAGPVLPPVIYISGMDLNCMPFEKREFVLPDFDSYEDLIEAVGKNLYVSVVDADNCDFENEALQVLDSEEMFDSLVDSYRSRL